MFLFPTPQSEWLCPMKWLYGLVGNRVLHQFTSTQKFGADGPVASNFCVNFFNFRKWIWNEISEIALIPRYFYGDPRTRVRENTAEVAALSLKKWARGLMSKIDKLRMGRMDHFKFWKICFLQKTYEYMYPLWACLHLGWMLYPA